MNRIFFTLVTTLMILAPSLAWAGGPNAESPEPSFWMFLLMGAIPAAWFLMHQHRTRQDKVAVEVRNEG